MNMPAVPPEPSKRLWTLIKISSAAAILVSVVAAIIGSIVYSRAITAVTVRVLDPEKEHRDKTLLGVGKEDALPDYRLEIIDADGRHHPCGTHVNSSAAEPLTWTLQEPFVLRKAASIRLVDEDKLEHDVLDEVQLDSSAVTGSQYAFTIATTRTFKSGMEYFISTPPGMVIAAAFAIALVATILGALPLHP